MTREQRLELLKQIEKDIYVPSIESTLLEEAKSCAIHSVIEELEQEPRWIPVSERLPENGQNVLFCDIDNDIMIGYHIKGRPNTHFSQDGTYEDMKNVRAWMPLPEPFEPQESEE